jgi:hypothetical protein
MEDARDREFKALEKEIKIAWLKWPPANVPVQNTNVHAGCSFSVAITP